MRKIFLPLGLALALAVGACSQGWLKGPGVTPSERVFAAKSEFATYLPVVKSYVIRPTCDRAVIVACQDPKVSKRLVEVARKVDTALDKAEVAVRNAEPHQAYLNLGRTALVELVRLLTDYRLLGDRT